MILRCLDEDEQYHLDATVYEFAAQILSALSGLPIEFILGDDPMTKEDIGKLDRAARIVAHWQIELLDDGGELFPDWSAYRTTRLH